MGKANSVGFAVDAAENSAGTRIGGTASAGRATSHEIAQVFADYLVAGLQNTDQAALSVAGAGRVRRRA